MNSSTIKQGDIVILDIPFSDFSETKKRPTLVISSTTYNAKSQDVVVASITSQLSGSLFRVDLLQNDLLEGKLKQDSSIKVDHPVTAHKKIIEMRIGSVTSKKMNKVKSKISELYELP